jgi:nitrile hydratase beta subunit
VNGIHDMGGMHGMGPVRPEPDEPVFHAEWEGRLFALRRAAGAWRRWNIDAMRHFVERVPPARYLAADYFGRQFLGFIEILVERGLVTREEIERGRAAPGTARLSPPLKAQDIPQMTSRGFPMSRDAAVTPGLRVGQAVRARDLNPTGHTRLPRYVRGRRGCVMRDHGVFVFPDSNAQFHGETPQHLYGIRFAARELWGKDADARDAVYLDLWEDYLDAVD